MTFRRYIGETEMIGEVADQAQLHGLLTRIRDLGLELGEMTVIDSDAAMSSHPERPAHERNRP